MIKPAYSPLSTVREYGSLSREELVARIQERKKELNAVILGHNYQVVDIQDVSDFVGDSLALSQEAAHTDADIIVFCGVHFMAETAKILSPEKTVLMPDPGAGCPMADFVTGEGLRALKAKHPDAAVVTYVNSSAEVKAESDICCTSANAVQVVETIPEDQPIIFVPDRNLAQWVIDQTGRDNIIPWEGYCHVHDDMVLDELEFAKEDHPNALVVIHPEARQELLDRADVVTSTSGMVRMAEDHDELIIGTERGLIDKLQKEHPEKTFVPLSKAAICGNMKANTLAKLAWSLDHLRFEVTMPEDIRVRAETALQKMLAVSGGWQDPTPEQERLEMAGVRSKSCGCA
ncbi:MAG: quinolinate synthase NadA [Gemmatimonadetes bacterium]|nr:quinolinate synthase NadA [Gemmatimonadota bacterium]NNM07418.1 quinolinate synthase NadA [Gemmatimonadota bacterium]